MNEIQSVRNASPGENELNSIQDSSSSTSGSSSGGSDLEESHHGDSLVNNLHDSGDSSDSQIYIPNSEIASKCEDDEPPKKRIKSIEYIATESVNEYLIQRGFSNMYSEPFKKVIPISTLASHFIPGKYSPNSILFGQLYDPKRFNYELERFWNFYLLIKRSRPSSLGNYNQFLFPLLAHLCEIAINSFRALPILSQLANSFSDKFLSEDPTPKSKTFVLTLKRYLLRTELQKNMIPPIHFGYEKRFVMGQRAFEKLKAFLSSALHPTLICVFTKHFEITIQETHDIVESLSSQINVLEEPKMKPNFISKLRESLVENLPSILTFTTNNEPISAAVSPEGSIIAYGTKDSGLRICLSSTANNLYSQLVSNLEQGTSKSNNVNVKNKPSPSKSKKPPPQEGHTPNEDQIKMEVEEPGSPGLQKKTLKAQERAKNKNLLENLLIEYGDSDSEDEDKRNLRVNSFLRKSLKKENKGKGVETHGEKPPDILKPYILSGHNGAIYDIAFHPRAKLLYSVGEDETMRLWDLNTPKNYKCLTIFKGHLGPIFCIDITKSGSMIVTGGADKTAQIWFPEHSKSSFRILQGHHLDVDCVKFHPNEAYVATGSIDKTVRLWSISDGVSYRMFTGFKGGINSLAFHENGKYILAGGEDNRIRVWDIAEGELLLELPCPFRCRDLSICGNMLSACFANNTVYIWNLLQILSDPKISSTIKTLIPPIPLPKKFEIESNALLALHYKDPSTLYCIGEDSKESWFVLNKGKPDETVLPKRLLNETGILTEGEEEEVENNRKKIRRRSKRGWKFSSEDSQDTWDSGNSSSTSSSSEDRGNEYSDIENATSSSSFRIPAHFNQAPKGKSKKIKGKKLNSIDKPSERRDIDPTTEKPSGKEGLSSTELTSRVRKERQVQDLKFLLTRADEEKTEYEQDRADILGHLTSIGEIIRGENQNLTRDIGVTPQFLDQSASLFTSPDDIHFTDIPSPLDSSSSFFDF